MRRYRAHVLCGKGRKVHIGTATGARQDHYITACGMGGFVGSWLTRTREPATCGSCLRILGEQNTESKP